MLTTEMNRQTWKWASLTVAVCFASVAVGLKLARHPQPAGPSLVGQSPVSAADPANAESDFRTIYRAIDSYRRKFGRLPAPRDLLGTAANHFKGLVDADAWTNPDTINSEGPDPQKRANGRNHYMVSLLATRVDGTRKPPFPTPGERDVWLVAPQYARGNALILPNHRSKRHLQGCYVVLWSDGKVERIPARDQCVVTVGKRGCFVFRGEAGMPKGAKVINVVDYWISRGQIADSE